HRSIDGRQHLRIAPIGRSHFPRPAGVIGRFAAGAMLEPEARILLAEIRLRLDPRHGGGLTHLGGKTPRGLEGFWPFTPAEPSEKDLSVHAGRSAATCG